MASSPPRPFVNKPLTGSWAASLPTLVLLLMVLLIGTGEMVHSRFLQWGQALYGSQAQYFVLRGPNEAPTCNAKLDVEAELQRQLTAPHAAEDLALERELGLDPGTRSEADLRTSITAAKRQCVEQHERYAKLLATTTDEVRLYIAIERGFFGLFRFGSEQRDLLVLLLMASTWLLTCVQRKHISLSAPTTVRDHQLQALSNLLAALLMLASSLNYVSLAEHTGVPLERPQQQWAWIGLQALVMLISAWQVHRAAALPLPPGQWRRAWRAMPLGSGMAILAGLSFLVLDHPSGLAIHLNALTEIPAVTLHLALFIWSGMLLKQTRMVDMFMNMVRPLGLSPETLTYMVLLAAALPTAYTGGSGAFVMAAGALIYNEIRVAGGSHTYALGATAMSGSLGVVLNPSLVILSIAAVNKEVTSDELFSWGVPVFVLTSTLFLMASHLRRWHLGLLARRQGRPLPVAGPAVLEDWRRALRQLPPLWSQLALMMAVAGFYTVALGTSITESSAAQIVPVMMLLVVAFDQLMRSQGIGLDDRAIARPMRRAMTFTGSVRVATQETALHFGGYIYLILMSQALGGAIERSAWLSRLPLQLDTPTEAVAVLALMLVAMGLLLEPLGAVLLVSGTLAPVAYASGISPIHFWMVVLVAFELGYLLPPVALNQLLAKQVVGLMAPPEPNASPSAPGTDAPDAHPVGWWSRHEHWLLPAGVMALALLIVAFVPLMSPDWSRTLGGLRQWLPR
ncbi:MAG: hypothetical protein RI907_1151 [Pseudomonadota bacterium]